MGLPEQQNSPKKKKKFNVYRRCIKPEEAGEGFALSYRQEGRKLSNCKNKLSRSQTLCPSSLKPQGRMLHTLAEIRISKYVVNICGKAKKFLCVLLLKPVTCEHHPTVVVTAARPEAWGCRRRRGLGLARQWVLQHHVAIS